MGQFAAQREAQACALAGREPAFHRALARYQALVAESPAATARQSTVTRWGPVPDPDFERCRVFEAGCLVDLEDFSAAARHFDQHMWRLGSARTGYARLAVRHAIACAGIGEPEHAVEIARGALPTVTRQGSASLHGDLRRLARMLDRYRGSAAVRSLLPDLAAAARTGTNSRHRPTRPVPLPDPVFDAVRTSGEEQPTWPTGTT